MYNCLEGVIVAGIFVGKSLSTTVFRLYFQVVSLLIGHINFREKKTISGLPHFISPFRTKNSIVFFNCLRTCKGPIWVGRHWTRVLENVYLHKPGLSAMRSIFTQPRVRKVKLRKEKSKVGWLYTLNVLYTNPGQANQRLHEKSRSNLNPGQALTH